MMSTSSTSTNAVSTSSARTARLDRRNVIALVGGALLAGALAFFAVLAALAPPRRDLPSVAALVAAPVIGAVLCGLALRRWIRHAHGLVRVLVVVSAVSAILVSAAVALAAWRMFLSGHDATIVVIVVALAAVLSILVTVQVTRPLAAQVRQLGEVAQQVAAGDLTTRTGIDRDDELGVAGRALDHMVARLSLAEAGRQRMENERRFLLSSIGHDLRTPLSALRAAVESLQDGIAPDPERYLAAMSGQLDAVESLIDDLVVYARIEAGQLRYDTTDIDLAELVDETVETMAPVAHRRGLELVAHCAGRAVTEGGSAELGRVLRNLIDNALRYGPIGSTVHVVLEPGVHTARLVVSDDGPGFPESFRPHAFEPFTRADPARDRATGTAGLGLAIARGIVDAHGGTISIGSAPGGLVEIHLPLRSSRALRRTSA